MVCVDDCRSFIGSHFAARCPNILPSMFWPKRVKLIRSRLCRPCPLHELSPIWQHGSISKRNGSGMRQLLQAWNVKGTISVHSGMDSPSHMGKALGQDREDISPGPEIGSRGYSLTVTQPKAAQSGW